MRSLNGMRPVFDKLYRQLRVGTWCALLIAFLLLGMAFISALLGVTHAVVSFRSAAVSAASAFSVLFTVFLFASIAVVAMRVSARRSDDPE